MSKKFKKYYYFVPNHALLFLPLIVMGGKLAVRIVLNLWNMVEGSAYHVDPVYPN
jgi:hypothetical protein